MDFKHLEIIKKKLKKKEGKYIFINDFFSGKVKNVINELFPKLSSVDINYLLKFTKYIVESIAHKFFNKNENNKFNYEYYEKFYQNNNQDIKMIILMLLPSIKNMDKVKDIIMLNQLLINDSNVIFNPNKFVHYKTILDEKFKYSKFGIDLLSDTNEGLLNTKYREGGKDIPLIHKILYNNFISILQTLDIVNGKLYVNWLNVLPLSLDNYKSSLIYQNTNKLITRLESKKTLNNIKELKLHKYNGLYLGDFYQVFRIKYYSDILKIKWVIFNSKIKNKVIYYIQYIDNLLDLSDTIFNYETFNDIEYDKKKKIGVKFKNLIYYLKSEKATIDDYNYEYNMLNVILYFLMNNYSKRYILYDNASLYNYVKKTNDELNEEIQLNEDDEIINNIELLEEQTHNVSLALQDLTIEHLWNYLKETIEILNTTVYGKYLIKNNKIINTNEDFKWNHDKINLKNIYNISKILSIDFTNNYKENEDNEMTVKQPFFISLIVEEKLEFIKKFFLKDSKNWINLKKNLYIQENVDFLSKDKLDIIINNISEEWELIKLDLVWEYLIENGLLTSFTPNNNLTDNSNFLLKKNKIKIHIRNLKEDLNIQNSYYYLSNEKYKDIKKIRFDDYRNNYKEYDFFDLLEEKQWFNLFSLDWINQIKFYNSYINNQVLFISGATGTGKSTQSPKLLLYGLKMYNFKNNGKIICTEPRITPTESNAERISTELGYPIKQKTRNVNIDEIFTSNYYVQFKHKKRRHDIINFNKNTLKLVTDGTLLNLLKNNLFMKKQVKRSGKKIDYIYSEDNEYDIIIIDEAHEHNTNMDLILTLCRDTAIINNSIKIVIISATLDEDEFIYRSFFKHVNDNLEYPIKNYIYSDFLEKDYFIDSILIDRKLNISPPENKTNFEIKSIFETDEQLNTYNIKKINNNILNKLKEIINVSSKGHILVFSTGEKEIRGLIEEINKKISNNQILALPFFSNLDFKYKDIIKDIDNQLYNIRNKKENVYNEWFSEYINNDEQVSLGTYKRAIIVATNIAEASITLEGLKYIVDSGWVKEMIYNSKTNESKTILSKINNSNMIQRKGRVGRTQSGVVYHLYKENEIPKKQTFKITQQNFEEPFLNLLESKNEDKFNKNSFVFTDLLPYFSNKIFDDIFNKDKDVLYDKGFIERNVVSVLRKQFLFIAQYSNKALYYKMFHFYDLSGIVRSYYDNNLVSKLINIKKNLIDIRNDDDLKNIDKKWNTVFSDLGDKFKFCNMTKDGYSYDNLIDNFGDFYLVHFKENSIYRNILNRISYIFSENTKRFEIGNKIPEIILFSFQENIESKLLVLNKTKTKLLTIIEQFQNYLASDLTINEILTIFYSYGFDLEEEVLSIIAFLKTINYSSSSLYHLDRYFVNSIFKNPMDYFIYLKNLYDKNKLDSELNIYFNLVKDINSYFKDTNIFKIKNIGNKLLNQYKEKYNSQVILFLQNYDKEPTAQFKNDWNILNYNKNNGFLKNDETEKGFKLWLNHTKFKILMKDELNIESRINIISKNLKISPKIIKTYLNNFIDLYIDIYTYSKSNDDIFKEEQYLDYLKNDYKFKSIKSGNNGINIKKLFFLANPLNILLKTNYINNRYYNFSYYQLNIILNNDINNDFFGNNFFNINNPILLYLSFMFDKSNILNSLNTSDLIEIFPHIYSPMNLQKYLTNKKLNKILSEFHGTIYDEIIYKINNQWKIDYFPLLNLNKFPVIYKWMNEQKLKSKLIT
jgi:hypothetical protein